MGVGAWLGGVVRAWLGAWLGGVVRSTMIIECVVFYEKVVSFP